MEEISSKKKRDIKYEGKSLSTADQIKEGNEILKKQVADLKDCIQI